MSPRSAATEPAARTWQFAKRFRKGATGWRSSSAIERLDGALSEIPVKARKAPVRAAEGAIYFFGADCAGVEHVDTSSGALSMAINRAIVKLVAIIAAAPVDNAERIVWLDCF